MLSRKMGHNSGTPVMTVKAWIIPLSHDDLCPSKLQLKGQRKYTDIEARFRGILLAALAGFVDSLPPWTRFSGATSIATYWTYPVRGCTAKRGTTRPGRRLYLLKVANVSDRRHVRERTLEGDEQSRFERTKRIEAGRCIKEFGRG